MVPTALKLSRNHMTSTGIHLLYTELYTIGFGQIFVLNVQLPMSLAALKHHLHNPSAFAAETAAQLQQLPS